MTSVSTTMNPSPAPTDLTATRLDLQRLAVHVLSRRRHAVTGRIGLRPAPGGLATPAFGDGPEVVRIDGRYLVHERGDRATVVPITTLAAAAELVGVDLSDEFSVGAHTPPLSAVDEPVQLDEDHVRLLAAWWGFGVEVIDEAIVGTSAADAPTLQLWPEHFDVAGTVTVNGQKLNIGASPGDEVEPTPYLYVGPWSVDRPGDARYWNASFGALERADDLPADGRRAAAVDFLLDGLRRFCEIPEKAGG